MPNNTIIIDAYFTEILGFKFLLQYFVTKLDKQRKKITMGTSVNNWGFRYG